MVLFLFVTWEQRKLGDVGSVAINRRIFKEQTASSGDVPFYKIGTFGGVADAFISEQLFEEYKTKYPYPKMGDILVSASGSIGRFVEYKGEKAYFQDSNIIWLEHNDSIEKIFLKAFYAVVKWAGLEGSTIKRLYNKNILDTEISLPSVKEQRQVGRLFEQLDNLITLHQREQKCKILLFATSKAGLFLAHSWEQRKLGDVAKINMGQSPDGANYTTNPNDAILVQGNADMSDGWVLPRVYTKQITKQAHIGDLIFSVRAPVGEVGKTQYNVVIGRGVAAISGNEFIFQSLKRMNSLGYWTKLAAGSTFESINSDTLKTAEFAIPKENEQTRIGEILLKIDNLITLHQRGLIKIQGDKNGKKRSFRRIVQRLF